MAPPSWFWSHDIRPEQVQTFTRPGVRLLRLADYGGRYAALAYLEPGAAPARVLHGTPEELLDRLRDKGTRPVSVTADPAGTRLTVVLDPDPGPGTRLVLDPDPGALPGVVDLVPYGDRYAVVVGEPVPGARVLTRVTAKRLRGTVPVRVRRHGRDDLTAVVTDDRTRTWWYDDEDADAVARLLSRHRAYPVDLDARPGADGPRFTVVMRR